MVGRPGPRELYAQNHPLSQPGGDHLKKWDWADGASTPSKAYCEHFYKRTISLIDDYNPDLVYFDDSVLPLWPVSDVGLRIAAHLYNRSIKKHGKLEAVLTCKSLDPQQRKCMVWDIERGQSHAIEPLPGKQIPASAVGTTTRASMTGINTNQPKR